MAYQRNIKLISKVLIVGVFIAYLSYLFHPDVGQFSIILNGQPIADPLVRFAAIPTFLAMLALTIIISIILFMGIGVFMLLGTFALAFLVCLLMAPYFWPVLAIIFLIIAVMSFSDHDKD